MIKLLLGREMRDERRNKGREGGREASKEGKEIKGPKKIMEGSYIARHLLVRRSN